VSAAYVHRMPVRYMEVDQQGVVFNAWYLTYMDESLTGWFDHIGLPYAELIAAGVDTQLVHTELDWKSGLRGGDVAAITVEAAGVGRTSFTLAFTIRRGDDPEVVVAAKTVYVCVRTDDFAKCDVPPALRAVLGG
jgi:acyl-CoA thioester hydrolase